MKYVINVRREMGIRTFFNVLGPLSNPAGVEYQVVGVYDQSLTEKLAKVLGELGAKHVFVVAAEDGLDEISLCSRTKVTEYFNGDIKTFIIDPKDYGFEYCKLSDLQVSDVEDSAKKVIEILENKKSPRLDVVILNAALILQVSGLAKDFKEGICLAKSAIESGKALDKFNKLRIN